MATYSVYNSEIKIFEDFIHSDNFDSDFFAEHNLSLGDVFLVAGEPYRIIIDEIDDEIYANHIESYGIDEWVLSGNTHPKVKWHGTYATYDGEVNVSLFSHNGGTYFYNPYTGEIIDSIPIDTRCEYTVSNSNDYSGEVGIVSWSDKGDY